MNAEEFTPSGYNPTDEAIRREWEIKYLVRRSLGTLIDRRVADRSGSPFEPRDVRWFEAGTRRRVVRIACPDMRN